MYTDMCYSGSMNIIAEKTVHSTSLKVACISTTTP